MKKVAINSSAIRALFLSVGFAYYSVCFSICKICGPKLCGPNQDLPLRRH